VDGPWVIIPFVEGRTPTTKGCLVVSVHDRRRGGEFGELAGFRREFYACLTRRADALFELADAVLCADGPVRSLVELPGGGHRYEKLAVRYEAIVLVAAINEWL
jgi:hypothetical protein